MYNKRPPKEIINGNVNYTGYSNSRHGWVSH